MGPKEEKLTDREKAIKQELAARRHIRKLLERREASLTTAEARVHKHYDKLVESYIANLLPEVRAALLSDVEDIEAEEVA